MKKKQVFIVSQFHCDVVWRRTPNEQIAIRQAQYDSAMDMLEKCPEFKFEFDQAVNVRQYLENNPHRLEQMQRFIKEDRISITGGEEAIPDVNLVSGEGLIRNILLGRLWFEDILDLTPRVANLDDAFGVNAQMPQIFSKFGYQSFRANRTPGLSAGDYPAGMLWEGLDGTEIYSAYMHGGVQLTQRMCNLPIIYTIEELAAKTVQDAFKFPYHVVGWGYSSEEDRVTDEIVQIILKTELPEGATMQFAHCHDLFARLRKSKQKLPVVKGEFNPTFTGCYTTRIRLKQAYREAESLTVCAETSTVCASLAGNKFPQKKLNSMWRKLAYVQFHDSICGCHSDEVYQHVMSYCNKVRRQAGKTSQQALSRIGSSQARSRFITVFNPLPYPRQEIIEVALPKGTVPIDGKRKKLPCERRGKQTRFLADLPPMGAASWKLARKSAPKATAINAGKSGYRFSVGPYKVEASDRSLLVVNKQWGRTLIQGTFPQIRFRHEDGTLWDEKYLGIMFNDESGSAKLLSCEKSPLSVRLRWKGKVKGDVNGNPLPPHWKATKNGKLRVFRDLEKLQWEKELIFYHDLPRIDVNIKLDLRGKNTEVIAGFPLELDLHSTTPIYSIPFGALERKPYFEIPAGSPEVKDAPFQYAKIGGKGSWPALNWVAYQDKDWGMIMANRGNPAHRLMGGCIETTLLRSPTSMASNFNVPELALDNGKHAFSFSLLPFKGDWKKNSASRLGDSFNMPVTAQVGTVSDMKSPSFLEIKPDNIAFSAFKKAERNDGIILRTYETTGRKTTGRIKTGFKVKSCQEVDLMENPVGEAYLGKLTWLPWEIKTLLLEL